MVGVLLLGPGTDISHRAVELIGDTGTSMVWVGSAACAIMPWQGVGALYRFWRNRQNSFQHALRLDVARKMYQLRFPDEDVTALTMQQLRGRSARVQRLPGIFKNIMCHGIKRV